MGYAPTLLKGTTWPGKITSTQRRHAIMPQALPSFVELLDSLDLEEEEDLDVQHYARYPAPSFVASSPSSSLPSPQPSPTKCLTGLESATQSFNLYPSPSIIISHPSPVHGDSVSSRRRSTFNRYNPYAPSNYLSQPFTRRRSLPGDLSSYPDHSHPRLDPHRASSASPPITGRRASLGNTSHEQSTHLSTTRLTRSKADQPISAFVRRRHPAQSPDSRKAIRRSVSPADALAPVSLPSLPPLPRISMRTGSPAPSFSDASCLPPISVLDHSLTSTSEHHDSGSRATSQTPTPPSHNFHDRRNKTTSHFR